jgi:hypothetical protein
MTVRENEVRIENVEEEVLDLDKRVTRLETDFTIMVSKLDLLIKMGRVLVGMVAAGLGVDLGIQGGVIWAKKIGLFW